MKSTKKSFFDQKFVIEKFQDTMFDRNLHLKTSKKPFLIKMLP